MSETAINVIPNPLKVVPGQGSVPIDVSTSIACDRAFRAEADALAGILRDATGLPLGHRPLSKANARTIAVRQVRSPRLGSEGYVLDVGENGIAISAREAAGAFYGCRTLLQLLPPQVAAGRKVRGLQCRVPCCRIEDRPRFGWRGLMLDESRHFFGKTVVKRILDTMCHLKLNVFHWHLTDDPGWRILIRAYPELTGIGARGNWHDSRAPRRFYTQDEIREVVEYARRRHIMIMPEIDMPGHAQAATRAYPEISGGGEGRMKGFTFNPASSKTYEFLETVLGEVAELFPGPYIHIGGDEVAYGNQSWSTDSQISRFIRERKLGDALGLEHYFLRRMSRVVRGLGKTMAGWDETVVAGVPRTTLVTWWRPDKKDVFKEALQKGHRAVMCPCLPCYFDFEQHSDGHGEAPHNTVEAMQAFPAEHEELVAAYASQIRGIQANVWTERIADTKRLGYMMYPRTAGLAESAWSHRDRKDRQDLLRRLSGFLDYLSLSGLSYYDPFYPCRTPAPWGPSRPDTRT